MSASSPPRPSRCWSTAWPATRPARNRSELDAVGPLQLLDPVVLDGDPVVLGELVVLRRRAVRGQDRRQLLEVLLEPGRTEDLGDGGRRRARVPHGVRHAARLDQVRARPRLGGPVSGPYSDRPGQHQRELVLAGVAVRLDQGPGRYLHLQDGQPPAGIPAHHLVAEPTPNSITVLPSPAATTLGGNAPLMSRPPGASGAGRYARAPAASPRPPAPPPA